MFSQSDETAAGVGSTASALAEQGARVFIAGASADDAVRLPTVRCPSLLELIVQIHSFCRAANALAIAPAVDPDQPPHLANVTETR